MSYAELKQEAVGKWVDIFARLGVNVGDGRHCPCPICGTPGKKPPFRFDNLDGTGTWICTHCGAGDGWTLLMKKFSYSFSQAAQSVQDVIGLCKARQSAPEVKADPRVMRKLMEESAPISRGDLAGRYLRNRGLVILPAMVRFGKCWEQETKQDQPAMLSVFSNPAGVAITIHRTFLGEDALKLGISEPKTVLPALGKMSGGAIRLFTPDKGHLGIAEGVETAIAATERFGIPTWAAVSSSILENFEPPKEITHLHIFADNDRNFAGQKAAYALAHKISVSTKYPDLSVAVHVPPNIGWDWLDYYVFETTKKIFNK
jgi:putative DNA primase/helicase